MDHEVPNILCNAGNIGKLLRTVFWDPGNLGNLKCSTFSVFLEILEICLDQLSGRVGWAEQNTKTLKHIGKSSKDKAQHLILKSVFLLKK